MCCLLVLNLVSSTLQFVPLLARLATEVNYYGTAEAEVDVKSRAACPVNSTSVRECCFLVLNSVTSTPQWIRPAEPEAAWGSGAVTSTCFVSSKTAHKS